MSLQRAIVVTAAATLLFPVAVFAIRVFTPTGTVMLPQSLALKVIRWSEGDAA